MVFVFVRLHDLLSNGYLYPTICIQYCACFSLNYCLFKTQMNYLPWLFNELSNQVNETCLFVLVVEHASELLL